MTNEEWQEINDQTYRQLKASIAHEQNKVKRDPDKTQMAKHILRLEAELKELRPLVAQNTTLHNVLDIVLPWISDTLEAKERIFQTDPDMLDYEAMADYHVVARFMEKYKNRPSLADEFWERMRSLNI